MKILQQISRDFPTKWKARWASNYAMSSAITDLFVFYDPAITEDILDHRAVVEAHIKTLAPHLK